MKLGGIATVQNAHGSRVLDASSLFLTYLTTNVEPFVKIHNHIPLTPLCVRNLIAAYKKKEVH
jgi:hypothetical protein